MRRYLSRWLIVLAVFCLILPLSRLSYAQDSPPDLKHYPLLYQRADPTSANDVAQIMMVGDVSLARGVATASATYGSDYPLGAVSPWLQAADLAVGNYEGVIAADGIGNPQPGPYRLRAQPDAANALAKAGFDLLNLANNHTMDWGADGLQATVKNLQQAGIITVGAGETPQSAIQPIITTVHGARIAWLSFTMVDDPGSSPLEGQITWGRSWFGLMASLHDLARLVEEAHSLSDIVIVQFHWGEEYTTVPQDWQTELARAAIDAGAALFVGHHPHVVQTIETYHNGLIVYSLGNFLLDQNWALGLTLWIRLDKQGVIDVRGIALRPSIHPRWYSASRSTADLRGLCQQGIDQAVKLMGAGDRYEIIGRTKITPKGYMPRQFSPGIREIGRIDLTGDGEPERIVLDDGRVVIYQGDQQVYATYSDWYTSDAALGDPNQDGRFEVIVLFWKQDKPGDPVTTHPFIIGYRGGKYQPIWGGSATSAQLQDLMIADVNGDHLDELVTIERDTNALLCDGRDRVVVTSWNGWGFTQRWRSDYGYFKSLGILQSGSGLPAIIAHGELISLKEP
jgi:poly-gamma-glutamate capsule biosynthesis protein CapA/YwtB (metallophosphatase superfamily)